MKQTKSAKGLKGYLFVGGSFTARKGELIHMPTIFRDAATGEDYEIVTPDMTITIEDDDAFIKECEDGTMIIDVSNQTLGKKDDE